MSAQLYHEQLVALAKRATGSGRLHDADVSVRVDNPLCGDEVTVDATFAQGQLQSIGHRVRGCLLCEAAASWMSEHGVGQTEQDVTRVFSDLESLLKTGELRVPSVWPNTDVFAPVHAAKSRHRCILLPLEGLLAAMREQGAKHAHSTPTSNGD